MFSKGFHARVYDVAARKDVHQLWGERADLARVEFSKTKHVVDAKILFYSHLIAHLLFPENTINVTGATMEGSFTWLYSKLASVPPEHALYSKHTFKWIEGRKVSDCPCDACKKHRQFHEDNGLQEKAKETSKKMKDFGIWAPEKDPTDYCMSPNGHIVFFEHDFSPYAAEKSVESQDASPARDRLLKLIERFETLIKQRKNPNRQMVDLNTDHSLTPPLASDP